MGTLIILDLLGSVALLLWGLHMVQSGILRAYGPDLRQFLSQALGHRWSAFLAGLGLTALLQSSTATGLMTTSFTAQGLVELAPALAIMLGANVGTTLIVQLLAFDIMAVAPILFLIGLVGFRGSFGGRIKNLGRTAIGFGLVLVALRLMLNILAPAEHAAGTLAFFGAISDDPVLCVAVAALFTWIAHSSVAAVLLIMSLAASGFVTTEATLALVLGANLGSAINPIIEGAGRGDPASYRLPVGNLINRLAGIALALPLLGLLADLFRNLESDPARMAAEFHIAFNLATAILFFGFLGPFARLLKAIRRIACARPAPRHRDISMKAPSKHHPSRLPTQPERRCIWAISSRSCCATS